MKRRDFMGMGSAACGLAAFTAGTYSSAQETAKPVQQVQPKQYRIEVEIFEARKDSWCHKQGDKFKYPEDMGRVCPWLRSSMHDFIRILESGGTLSWRYEGTPYQKSIDPDGVTTEFVRCPDPTSNLVAKIIRTRIA